MGTAIATLARRRPGACRRAAEDAHRTETVQYRDFWGTHKLRVLDGLARADVRTTPLRRRPNLSRSARLPRRPRLPRRAALPTVTPDVRLGLPFAPRATERRLPRLADAPRPVPRLVPRRQDEPRRALVDVDRDALEQRMRVVLRPGPERHGCAGRRAPVDGRPAGASTPRRTEHPHTAWNAPDRHPAFPVPTVRRALALLGPGHETARREACRVRAARVRGQCVDWQHAQTIRDGLRPAGPMTSGDGRPAHR